MEPERLMVNLRIVASLQPHQRINSKAEPIQVEPDTWIPQSIHRWFRDDDRNLLLRRLNDLVTDTDTHVMAYAKRPTTQKKLLRHLNKSKRGLQNLLQTYANDITTVSRLDLLQERVNDILTKHNFKVDEIQAVDAQAKSDDMKR